MNSAADAHREQRFDVRAFARTAVGSHRSELDLDAIRAAPPAEEIVRALAVLRDAESSTMTHLRNVLVTPTHKDAQVTAFLVTWAFEKFWIADTLAAVVEAVGGVGPVSAPGGPRSSNERRARRGPVARAVAALADGTSIVAAHLALGFADDLVLDAAYSRIASETNETVAVADAIAHIRRVKERHSRFFRQEASARLDGSPRAVRLARRELRSAVLPLGALDLPMSDRAFLGDFAFGDEEGDRRIRGLTDALATLPGVDQSTTDALRSRILGSTVIS